MMFRSLKPLAHTLTFRLFTMLGCLGMLLLQGNMALACRLLTVVSVKPVPELMQEHYVTHSRSLMHQAHDTEPYYQTAGQSLSVNMLGGVVPTVDGVGLVGFNAQHKVLRPFYYRNATSLATEAAQQKFSQAVKAVSPQATVMLGNLRAKTQGAVDASNNHPFLVSLNRDASKSTWAFMGNGGTQISKLEYQAWVKDARIKASPARLDVMTDTEMLFHVLMQDALPLLEAPMETPDALAKTISTRYAAIQGRIPPSTFTPFSEGKGYATLAKQSAFDPESRFLRYWPKTWAMSNGRFTFIMVHGYDQWLKIHYGADGKPETLVFASEPTDIEEYYAAKSSQPLSVDSATPPKPNSTRWQQLPQDSLAVAYVTPDQQVQVKLYPVVMKQTAYPAMEDSKQQPEQPATLTPPLPEPAAAAGHS
jgi:hypothetical protein